MPSSETVRPKTNRVRLVDPCDPLPQVAGLSLRGSEHRVSLQHTTLHIRRSLGMIKRFEFGGMNGGKPRTRILRYRDKGGSNDFYDNTNRTIDNNIVGCGRL